MKKIAMVLVFLFVLFSQSVTYVPAQSFTIDVWVEEGCGAEYHVGDMLTVHWQVSHDCTIIIVEEEPDGTRRKLTTHGIMATAGHGSRGWTLKDYGYGRREIQASGTSEYGSDSDECEFYVVEENGGSQDADGDGVPDGHDNCYNPGCYIVDSRGCPEDSDSDGVDDCDDDCPYDDGPSSNDGCPIPPSDNDGDGVNDDQDYCYNPGCHIVDSQGCPLDSDSDGVYDCDDSCPSEYGERSNNGCPFPPVTTTPSTSPTPPQPSSDFSFLFILLPIIAVLAIGVPLLMRKEQEKRTVLRNITRPYDDDTKVYDDDTRKYDDTRVR
jgi:hypothetical protein